MHKKINAIILIFLILYVNFQSVCGGKAIKAKFIKKLIKTKLLASLKKGVTKVVIPLLFPLPIPIKMGKGRPSSDGHKPGHGNGLKWGGNQHQTIQPDFTLQSNRDLMNQMNVMDMDFGTIPMVPMIEYMHMTVHDMGNTNAKYQ